MLSRTRLIFLPNYSFRKTPRYSLSTAEADLLFLALARAVAQVREFASVLTLEMQESLGESGPEKQDGGSDLQVRRDPLFLGVSG